MVNTLSVQSENNRSMTKLLGVDSLRLYPRELKELDLLFYFMPYAAPPVLICDTNFDTSHQHYMRSLALLRIYKDAQLRLQPLPAHNLEIRVIDGRIVKSEIALDEKGSHELGEFLANLSPVMGV